MASLRTSSQPSSTIGAMTIASTFWLMNDRTAAICAAGSLSAALNTSSKPLSSEKAVFIDSVFALRHPLSEPVCAKPTVMTSPLPPPPPASLVPLPDEHPVTARATAPRSANPDRIRFRISKTSSFWPGIVAGLGVLRSNPSHRSCDGY